MLCVGTVENHGKNGKKNTANFRENRKKIMAKTRHQITGLKTIIQSIKLNICSIQIHTINFMLIKTKYSCKNVKLRHFGKKLGILAKSS